MKITKLNRVKNYRIFQDFSWPSNLPEFAQFNIIYGWNGSGKTSLSNIFRHIQRRQPLVDGQVEIYVDQNRVAGTDFSTASLPEVRVFNRDAVERNIFESTNQEFSPIFFLGEDSAEKQQKIEDLKKQIDAKTQGQSFWELKRSDAASALEAFCAEEAKGIKNLLTVAGRGPFNNYNSANFKVQVQNLSTATLIPPLLKDNQRQQYLTTKDGKAMAKLSGPSGNFPDFTRLTMRTQAMLSRSVVSSVIAELTESPIIAGWVNSGLSLHTGHHASSKCRFCDQPLPERRIQQLESHFNNEFKRFQSDIDNLVADITSAKAFQQTLYVPVKESLYEALRPEYERTLETLNQKVTTVQLSLDILLRALNAKRDEPFKSLELGPFITSQSPSAETMSGVETIFQVVMTGLAALSAVMGKTAFDQLTKIIARHNDHTDSFDAAVKAARELLAQDEVIKALPEWTEKSKAVREAESYINTVREEAVKLKEEISVLEIQVRQHRRPAEELNLEIAAYLGRDELRFEVEKNGYRITRGGNPAIHLSDGERTAVAFLYFLKSLQGIDFNLKNGIVVIDDPVSSLDTNSIFSAFGFMKQRMAEVGQLFVLTHNFTFFRQVRNWFHYLPNQRKTDPNRHPAHFYMLVTDIVNGRRGASLQELDSFLYQYESEYHYLFKRVFEEANKPNVPYLETYYSIPNIARRLLEAFLAFRVPNISGDLYKKLNAIDYDPAGKTRILRFLHTYSHFDQVAESNQDPSGLAETPLILQNVLSLIRKSDPDHFKCMEDLVSPRASQ